MNFIEFLKLAIGKWAQLRNFTIKGNYGGAAVDLTINGDMRLGDDLKVYTLGK